MVLQVREWTLEACLNWSSTASGMAWPGTSRIALAMTGERKFTLTCQDNGSQFSERATVGPASQVLLRSALTRRTPFEDVPSESIGALIAPS